MALMVFCMGVRRNNSSYIRAGQLSFALLFQRSSSSNYALLDLHDKFVKLNYLNLMPMFTHLTLQPLLGKNFKCLLLSVANKTK